MSFKHIKISALFLLVASLGSCSLALGPEMGSDKGSVFDYFWDTFDLQYSLFEQKGIDWNASKAVYRDQALHAASDGDLFDVLASMIEPLDDGHVWLSGAGGYYFCDTWEHPGIPAPGYQFYLFRAEHYMEYLSTTGSGLVSYGKMRDRNIGYIHISSMSSGLGGLATLETWVEDVDRVIDSYMDTDALIIDVRGNTGGYSANAEHIASRFVGEKSLYLKTRVRIGAAHDDFGQVTSHYIEPYGTRYAKPVYLVTDAETVSAGEWFTLMMRKGDNVTHIGWRTLGATGMVSFHELPNGWEFSTTIGHTTDENGICYEEKGIVPEIVTPYDSGDYDSVMEWILDL